MPRKMSRAPRTFGVGERIRQKDGVARRNVGDGNAAADLGFAATFGDGHVSGQGRAAEDPQVDLGHDMLDGTQVARQGLGGL